ncbi:hypothetical protein [Sorangium sp. So ce1153]|uniref:hypothetical protein n=1 Tax=Sorangium sp. So ce1153 TaxID=3133333 RepID=UPI003F5F635A
MQRLSAGEELRVAVGNEQNEWREYSMGELALNTRARDAIVAGTARDPRFLLTYLQDEGVGYEGAILVYGARPDGTVVGPERVLDAFTRASATNPVATSADGERVALGNSHVTWDPRIVLLDKDGQKVSDTLLLIESGGDALADCFSLTGTMHGVLAHVLNQDTGDLRVVELDAAGEIVQDVTWPMPEGAACPRISVDPSGIYFAFPQRQDAGPTDVYSLDGGTLTRVATLPARGADSAYAWVLGGEEPLIWIGNPGGASFARLVNGELVELSGQVSGSVLSTEGGDLLVNDGRVFLTSRIDDVTSIVEVACGAAGRAPAP